MAALAHKGEKERERECDDYGEEISSVPRYIYI
jgi:hypothetical protein